MRQVGVIAGPGLVAIREMPAKLQHDHDVAKALAAKLAQNRSIDMEYVPRTNMMHFKLKHVKKSVPQIVQELKDRGVLVCGDETRWRLVTHYAVEMSAIDHVAESFDQVLNH